MIRVRRTTQLPSPEQLSEFGAYDVKQCYQAWGPQVARSRMWEVYEGEAFLGQFGIHEGSPFGGGVVLWFFAGRDFCLCSYRTLRRFRTVLRRVVACWPHVRVYVKNGFDRGERFARFMGFSFALQTEEYKVYEIWPQQQRS